MVFARTEFRNFPVGGQFFNLLLFDLK